MTNVTAIVKDVAGNIYANALVEASFLSNIPTGTGSGPPLASGSVFQTFAISETDSFGNLAMKLTDLATITPVGGAWSFNVVNSARTIGFSLVSTAVTGATVDLTAAFQAASAPLNPPTGFGNITVTGLTNTGTTSTVGLTSTGVILAVDGTAAAPSYSFANATNSGIGQLAGTIFLGSAGVVRALVAQPEIRLSGSTPLAWSSSAVSPFNAIADVGFSRTNPGTAAIGSGAQGDKTGTFIARSYGGAWFDAATFTDVPTAIAALPAAGGVIDARSPSVNLALGTIDPGSDSKAVTVLLGPYSYTCDHIVLRGNLRIIGTSPQNISGFGTLITSVGANAQPLVVNVTAGLINVRGALLSNFTLIGAAANTSQQGMFLDVSGNTTLSVIDHMRVENVSFSGFKGNSIHLKGSLNIATLANFIQLSRFDHVEVVRPVAAAEALRIEGAVGQIDCYSCQFDGPAKGDGNNIFVGMTSNTDATFPYSINFYSCTSQAANTAFTGDGFNQVGFYSSHHENLNGAYLLQASFTNSRNDDPTFDKGYFANVGANVGAGFILKSTTPFVYGAKLMHSVMTTVPDKIVVGSVGAEINTEDNSFPQGPANPFTSSAIDAQINPAATVNLGRFHTVMVQGGATAITTINSSLGPGEFITFIANGTMSFNTGGNIALPGVSAPLVLNFTETAVFTNTDYNGTNVWRLVSTPVASRLVNWQGPGAAITGTGADANVYTFTIPAGAMQAGKGIEVKVAWQHTTGAAAVTYKLKYGATTVATNSDAGTGFSSLTFTIMNNPGVTNAQSAWQDSQNNNAVVYTAQFATPAENTAGAVVVSFTFNVAATDQVTPKAWLIKSIQ